MPSKEMSTAISAESVDHLDDVCKGKPRRFVMLCKGPSIVSLAIYKKGSIDKFIKEAKTAGTGTVSFGVVGGKGPNITFQLATADGFKEAPTTAIKLKSFLKDSAERTIANPEFTIVDKLGPLLDPDDPLVARFVKLQEMMPGAGAAHPARAAELNGLCTEIGKILDADPSSDDAYAKIGKLEGLLASLARADENPPAAPAAATSAKLSGPPAPPNPEALRFAQRLKPLKPDLDKVLAGNVPVTPAVQTVFAAASQAFKRQDFPAAHRALDELEPLIRRGVEELASKALLAGDPAALLNERLKKLLPVIKGAVGTPAGNEAKLRVSEAGVFAQKKDFVQANALLDQAEAALGRELEKPPAPQNTSGAADQQGEGRTQAEDTGPDPDEPRWLARRQEIEEHFQKALKVQPVNAGNLRAVLSFADAKADAGAFSSALLSLDSLEKLLQAVGKVPAVVQEWQAICAEVRTQLRKLQGEIVKAKDVNSSKASIRLQSVLKQLVFQPSNQQDVVELEGWIRADDVITRLEQPNPWGPPVRIREKLLPALKVLKKQLPE